MKEPASRLADASLRLGGVIPGPRIDAALGTLAIV
jgi:hypothetical protein